MKLRILVLFIFALSLCANANITNHLKTNLVEGYYHGMTEMGEGCSVAVSHQYQNIFVKREFSVSIYDQNKINSSTYALYDHLDGGHGDCPVYDYSPKFIHVENSWGPPCFSMKVNYGQLNVDFLGNKIKYSILNRQGEEQRNCIVQE